MGHLAKATQQSDCLVVIGGAGGSGKTALLNRHISSLGDDIHFASIAHTCEDDKQFYCSFLSQLGFGDITGKPDELRRITKEFLVHRGMAGDPVLLILDNANLINAKVLEQLRWVSTIKVDDTRAISVILAGNSDLLRIMDSPAMSEVKFRSQVRFNIRAYTDEETVSYVRHRLKLAGGMDNVRFTSDAHPLIYRYTGGIPRLINMLCNAVLTEAHAAESRVVTDELVRSVADSRRLVPHMVPLQGKGRRRTDPGFKFVNSGRPTQDKELDLETTTERPLERNPKSLQAAEARKVTGDEDRPDVGAGEQSPRPKDRQRIAPSPMIPTVDATRQDVEGTNLLEQISRLSEQLGEVRAERNRALEDISARDETIGELRSRLEARVDESDKLANALEHGAAEVERLKQALSVNTKALQNSNDYSAQLAAELEKERNTAAKALIELSDAKAASEQLGPLNAELQSAFDALAGAEQRINSLQQQMSAMAEANSDLAADLEMERGAAETALAEARWSASEIGDLKAELQSTVAALATSEEKIDDLERQVAALAEANSGLSADLGTQSAAAEKALAELAEARANAQELSAELQAAIDAGADRERLIDDLERQAAALTEANGGLAADLDAQRSAAESALAELAEARAGIEELGELRAELRTAVDDRAEREQKVADLERELADLADANRRLAADLEKQTIAANTALSNVDRSESTTKELADLRAELQAAADALADREREASDLGRQLSALTAANGDIAAELDNQKSVAESALAELAEARADAQEINDLKNELQSKIDDLAGSRQKIADLERQLSAYAEANSGLAADLELAGEQMDRVGILELAAADLMDQLSKQGSELQALRSEVATRDGDLDEFEKLIQETQQDREALRVRVAAAEGLSESLLEKQQRIAELESELGKYRDAISSLKARNEELGIAKRLREEDLDRLLSVEKELIASRERMALLEEELELRARELAAAGDVAALESELREIKRRLAAAESKPAEGSSALEVDTIVKPRGFSVTALDVIRKGQIERTIEVADGHWRMMIGRDEDNELFLDSKYVSRHHAMITCSEEAFCIEDLNSRNGTAVNSKRITRCDLRAGDIVAIGNYKIRLRDS